MLAEHCVGAAAWGQYPSVEKPLRDLFLQGSSPWEPVVEFGLESLVFFVPAGSHVVDDCCCSIGHGHFCVSFEGKDVLPSPEFLLRDPHPLLKN